MKAMADTRSPLARRDFLICCLLVCCALLTIASFTFAMYTVKEFSDLKVRVSELEANQGNIHLLFPKSNAGSKTNLKDAMKSAQVKRRDEIRNPNKRAAVIPALPKLKKTRKRKHGASILLIGNGQRIAVRGKLISPIFGWRITHKIGSIAFNNNTGSIVINVPGVYFIYSQLQVSSRKQMYWAHMIYINDKQVVKRVNTVPYSGRSRAYDSSYQGAAFPLKRGDRVSVRGSGFETLLNHRYFGAVLLSRIKHT